MKNYELYIENKECIIYSTSYINPLSEIKNIEKYLKKENFIGNVYFDLLTINGFSNNRFIEAKFEKGYFELDKLKKVTNIYGWLKEKSRNFYSKNIEMLENSTLTKVSVSAIKNGDWKD